MGINAASGTDMRLGIDMPSSTYVPTDTDAALATDALRQPRKFSEKPSRQISEKMTKL